MLTVVQVIIIFKNSQQNQKLWNTKVPKQTDVIVNLYSASSRETHSNAMKPRSKRIVVKCERKRGRERLMFVDIIVKFIRIKLSKRMPKLDDAIVAMMDKRMKDTVHLETRVLL